MRTLILASLLLAAVFASTADVQSFNIEMDAAPEQRWSEIIKVKGEAIRKTFPEIIKLYRAQDPSVFNKIASNIISRNLYPDFQKEVHAISRLANVPFRTALLANFVYEILAFGCTSAIARDVDGRPWLGRNLDYYIPAFIGQLVVKINWMKDGKVEFITEHFAGMVGATTGMKPGAFAISINERKSSTFEENMAHVLNPYYESPMLTILRTLKTAGTYEQALGMLSSAMIMAPCYMNIVGTKPDEGAILTRDFDTVVDQVTLADEPNNFFIVQTNSDRNKRCYRKETAIQNLNSIGKNGINASNMVDKVLAIAPTKNALTVFSVAYCPATNDRHMQMWVGN